MIAEAEQTGDARAVITGVLDRGEKLMGFGHRVYRAEDPARGSRAPPPNDSTRPDTRWRPH